MIGIDIVSIARIAKFIERFGDKALTKFLDNDEIHLAKSIETIAGFFAAKEAISKALGLGISSKCGFFDIKLYKDTHNAPFFTLSQHLVDEFAIADLTLSISHDAGFAIAVASIEGKKASKSLSHNSSTANKL
ncbi:MAG: holo-ACP synthase [Sulfurospirillaceae bacterium]|nr:holo-ACP synthase [Sulfurospirillaceae bacterium]MDD2826065.1 holo-ACP synthase [Sulfurospirillaceae bacterium]